MVWTDSLVKKLSFLLLFLDQNTYLCSGGFSFLFWEGCLLWYWWKEEKIYKKQNGPIKKGKASMNTAHCICLSSLDFTLWLHNLEEHWLSLCVIWIKRSKKRMLLWYLRWLLSEIQLSDAEATRRLLRFPAWSNCSKSLIYESRLGDINFRGGVASNDVTNTCIYAGGVCWCPKEIILINFLWFQILNLCILFLFFILFIYEFKPMYIL